MKKRFCFGIVLIYSIVLLLTLACKSTSTTPLIYTNNISADFEILGEIFYETKDNERTGYIDLLRAARNLYPECDFVIDIMIDQRKTETTIPIPVRIVLEADATWIMRGTAIRYR